jgi:hypothetical protein
MEIYRGYLNSFIKIKAKKAEADAASTRVASGESPRFVEDHLPRLLVEIDAVRHDLENASAKPKKAKASPSPEPITSCLDCSGVGLVPLWNSQAAATPTTSAAHCTCAYGRWMRSRTKPADVARIPDLADIRENESQWTTIHPGDFDDAELDRLPASFRRLLAERMRVKPF